MEWRKDKKLHAIVGAFMGMLGMATIPFIADTSTGKLALVLGLIVSSNLVFIVKELWDCKKPNATGFSIDDIIAGNVGLLGVVALLYGAFYV